MDYYTIKEKEILSKEMELYFISGVVGLFAFFEFAFCAKGFESSFIYLLSQCGMLVSGILYITSYCKINDYVACVYVSLLNDNSYRSRLLLRKEKKKIIGLLFGLIASIILLIFSINGASNLMYRPETNDLFWPFISFVSTVLSSIILAKLLLLFCNSWTKCKVLKKQISLKKHTIILRKQMLSETDSSLLLKAKEAI